MYNKHMNRDAYELYLVLNTKCKCYNAHHIDVEVSLLKRELIPLIARPL